MMMTIKWQHWGGVLLASMMVGLVACSSNPFASGEGGDAEKVPVKAGAKRSACGNDPTYTIEGKTYQVLDSAAGYVETGTASWYGAEYQGTETAGCETFDMYAYSAAHRSLPLPSFVRVTNQQNGKELVVRVNDRGPFESNDLIQLSFAAANALGITQKTGTPVKVEALSEEQLQGQLAIKGEAVNTAIRVLPSEKKSSAPVDKSKVYYIVAGAWPERNPAIDMFVRLTSVGLSKTELATGREKGKTVHQIRVGPLYEQDQIDQAKDMLESNGLANFKVVAQ